MRKWINLVTESFITEVEDGSDFPIMDNLGDDGILDSYLKREADLVQIGDIDGHSVMVSQWPVETFSYAFLVDPEGNPLATFDLSPKNEALVVTYAFITAAARRKGLGYAFYEFLLNKGFTVESGRSHTTSSKALWAKLAREHEVTANGEVVTGELPYGGRKRFIVRKKS